MTLNSDCIKIMTIWDLLALRIAQSSPRLVNAVGSKRKVSVNESTVGNVELSLKETGIQRSWLNILNPIPSFSE